MALSKEEQQIVQFGQEGGKSSTEIMSALSKFRGEQKEKDKSGFFSGISNWKETLGDLKEGFLGVGDQLLEGGEEIVETIQEPGRTIPQKVVEVGAEAFRTGSRAFGEGVLALGKTQLTQEGEDAVKAKVGEVAQKVASTESVQGLIKYYDGLDPENKRQLNNALGFAEGLLDITGFKGVVGATKLAGKGATEGLEFGAKQVKRIPSLFKRASTSIDDVIEQADEAIRIPVRGFDETVPVGITRQVAEGAAPKLSLKEKFIDLSPDIKKRIAGKQDKLQEYFDVAHSRNLDDTLPTPFEYGADQARRAVGDMETILNDTGGQIGKTRQKLGTIQAGTDEVVAIENSFKNQLNKLNLEIVNGKVVRKAGTVTKVDAVNDIKVLNDIYQEFKVVRQSPTLTNLIDLRDVFSGKIAFAKSAREASNSVDPLSRALRKDIANLNAKMVGKSEAAELTRYSEFIEAYNNLRSFTDRKAGGEYLLRLVLSGRGGEARKIISTIKEFTGIDLMDDATMMVIATDLIGNSRQTNLFRQEITKAGLDVAQLLKGDPRGAAGLLSDFIKKRLLNEEDIFLKAAGEGQ